MTIAIADTTVVIHLYRRYSPALAWFDTLPQPLGITPISWMEVVVGAVNEHVQDESLRVLRLFNVVHLTIADQDWAIRQLARYRLSHGADMNDCMIAAVAYRLQTPLYTHNLKDMTLLLGNQLAVRPYP